MGIQSHELPDAAQIAALGGVFAHSFQRPYLKAYNPLAFAKTNLHSTEFNAVPM